jgi:hypothetical protein
MHIRVLLSMLCYMFRRLLRHLQREVYHILKTTLLLNCLVTDLKLYYICVYSIYLQLFKRPYLIQRK